MLDGVEAYGAEPEGITYSLIHLLRPEVLHQPQHLDELPLASPAHPRLQPPPQHSELLRQLPPGQGSRLVQRSRLALQQRQVVDRVEDEVVAVQKTPNMGNPGLDRVARGREWEYLSVALGSPTVDRYIKPDGIMSPALS